MPPRAARAQLRLRGHSCGCEAFYARLPRMDDFRCCVYAACHVALRRRLFTPARVLGLLCTGCMYRFVVLVCRFVLALRGALCVRGCLATPDKTCFFTCPFWDGWAPLLAPSRILSQPNVCRHMPCAARAAAMPGRILRGVLPMTCSYASLRSFTFCVPSFCVDWAARCAAAERILRVAFCH